ncbi:hypothetical protein KKE92_01315 [Candidatus Micrarchaeota archaeon]|nr:hypothetical protein [Candidatus Micrarchaeota archaeon]
MGKNEVLSALAEILEDTPSHGTKNDRIILQKLVYLFQRMKNAPQWSKEYSFNWYFNGPYSPGLANDYYSDEVFEKVDLRAEPIQQLKEFLGDTKFTPDELELLASILYQIKKHPELKEDVEAVSNKICSLKSKYTKEEVKVAYERLMKADLFQL